MNKITLNYIAIKNIRTITELEMVFDPLMTTITGANTKGKSTILYSCLFALYGLQGTPLTREEFFRTGERSGSVKLIFSVDGKKFIVNRNKSTSNITDKEGDELANGHSNVTKYIQDVLHSKDTKGYLIDASSVVEATAVEGLTRNFNLIQGYTETCDALTKAKEDMSSLKDSLVDMTRAEVISEDLVNKAKEQSKSWMETSDCLINARRDLTRKEKILVTRDRLVSVGDIGDIGEAKDYLGLLSDKRERLEQQAQDYGEWKKKLAVSKELEGLMSLEEIEAELAIISSQQKYIKLKVELDAQPEVVDDKPYKDQIAELEVALVSTQEFEVALKEYHEYERLLGRIKNPNRSSEELKEDLYTWQHITLLNNNIKAGSCRVCGSVLDPEKIQVATNELSEITVPDISEQDLPEQVKLMTKLEDTERPVEPENPNAGGVKELEKSVKDLNGSIFLNNQAKDRRARLEEVMSDFDTSNYVSDPGQDLLSLTALKSRVKGLTLDLARVEYAQEVADITDSDQEFLENYHEAYADASSELRLLKKAKAEADELIAELEGLGELPHVTPEQVAELSEKLSQTSNMDWEGLAKQREDAIAHNKRYNQTKADLEDQKDFCRQLSKAITTTEQEVWSTLLYAANSFIVNISDGVMSELNKVDGAFSFTEYKDGETRRVGIHGASGYQKTLIGLGLRISQRHLAGDGFPLLLDEVSGRLSKENEHKFLEALGDLGVQIIYITHNKESVEGFGKLVEI